MSNATDALKRAIDYIHATEVAPGRYAWHDAERGCYRVVGEEMMEALGWQLIYHIAPHDTIRMAWENQEMGVDLPEWWSPEHQFAVRFPDGRVATPALTLDRTRMDARILGATAITTNFETGAEVPA